MPELKHTFMSGRMNKDLDERLVPNGEYRDAWNVEVLTSEGSNMGTVQTCLGNNLISNLVPDDESACVGNVVDDKTNKVYYFIAGKPPAPLQSVTREDIHVASSDLVVEYNSVNNETLPVIVDIYNVRTEITERNPNGNNPLEYEVLSTAGLRIGMEVDVSVTGIPLWTQQLPRPIITEIPTPDTVVLSSVITNTNGSITLNNGNAFNDPSVDVLVNFTSGSANDCCGPGGRVLNFHRDRLITGVNIVDDMLFWTDNFSEPKKVNITRGKQGSIPPLNICQACDFNHNTANPYTFNGVLIPGTTHTELIVEEETITNISQNGILLNPPFGIQEYIQEKHITVIKKAPLTPPRLEMYDSVNRFDPVTRLINPTTTIDSQYDWFGSLDGGATTALYPVDTTSIEANDPINGGSMAFFDSTADFRVGDVLLATDNTNADPNTFSGVDVKVKLLVISSDSTATNPVLVQGANTNQGNLHVKILYIDLNIVQGPVNWYVRLENETQPLYELKFPKFGYRYKYEDGEYSAFSPFSEIAFSPQEFDYHPKKGYNKGMMNGLKQLFIKDFIPPNIPLDVVEIDILYKESDSPNIYTIRTFDDKDPEWDISGTGDYRGYFEIKDDLIHAVVASNQLLRPWDNVPRKALGQEVTGNRLIYGNYLQNYDLTAASDQQVKPEFKTVVENNLIGIIGFPETSLKSMRTYQLGIVYKDVYGRETPVITHPSGVSKLDTSKAISNNKFIVQTTTPPPFWADSFKYFVKEVSNEYYNLAMDRWYYAGDDNIWLSFPSEDRNKVDDETTIILKKTNLSNDGVPTSGFVPETPRYKILAIENEAPDFIKTVKSSMGKLSLGTTVDTTDPNDLVSGGVGSVIYNSIFPFKGFDQIQIVDDNWEGSPFASLQNDENKSGYLTSTTNRNSSFMVRLLKSDGSDLSDWYDITNITFSPDSAGATDGHYTVKIDGIFKDDVLFATSLSPSTTAASNATTGIIADLEIEIGKKTMQNKAQFDGRFFVKIESDPGGVGKYIMGSAASYLSSTNTLTSGLADAANVLTWRVTDSKQLFFNAYNVQYDPTAPEGSRYLPSNTSVGLGDETEIRSKTDWVALITNQSNGFTAPSGPSASVYAGGTPKRSRWYIDMEPAAHGSPIGSINHPGRGAELGVAAMDISWAGVYTSYVTSVTPQDVGNGFPDEQPFIDLLETKGRRFRFTNDPDAIVYTITDWSTHDCYTYTPYDGAPENMMKRWRLTLDKPIGDGAITTNTYGTGSNHPWQPTNPYTSVQYNDPSTSGITGTVTSTLASQGSGVPSGTPNILGAADEKTMTGIEFVEPYYSNDNEMPVNPAIWETEPKEDVGLDIYYEIGQAYPVNMCDGTEELYIQPGATVSMYQSNMNGTYTLAGWDDANAILGTPPIAQTGNLATTYPAGTPTTILSSTTSPITSVTSITGCEGDIPTGSTQPSTLLELNNGQVLNEGDILSFTNPDGTVVTATVAFDTQWPYSAWGSLQAIPPTYTIQNQIYLNALVHGERQTLPYYNCYTYGNGVESNRIRDLFNAVTIDKGVKASTTLAEQYKEEDRKSGLIFSGIYNSMNGVNRLNQFVMAEDITKDLNPEYGSIQKLHTRDDDLITLCEDKVIKVLANKDALYNADDTKNITASRNVLGYAKPFVGEFGISKNPESFASESFRAYFTDKERGAVMRLSRDGLTPISDHGMKDWFADNLKFEDKIIGSYDKRKSLYNITLRNFTENNYGSTRIRRI
jgi:hypothetical protein